MFDRILNATLPNNFIIAQRSEEKFSSIGVTQGSLGIPLSPNSPDLHQKNNKMS